MTKPMKDRHYVVRLDFESGGHGVPFIHGILAKTEAQAYRILSKYMRDWYGPPEKPDAEDGYWLWPERGVSVRFGGIKEVRTFQDLWVETLPIKEEARDG